MTATIRTNTAPTPTTIIELGDLVPTRHRETDSFGRPKILDPLPSPDPDSVAALLPSHRPAAQALAQLRDEARVARAAYDRLDSVAAEQEDHRRAAFGEQPDALETRPARVRAARLAAAESAAMHFAGLARWSLLMQDVEFGVELRARAQERKADVGVALKALAQVRETVAHVDQLHAVRTWLEPQARAVRNVTDAPTPNTDAGLVDALDHVCAILLATIADAPDPAA